MWDPSITLTGLLVGVAIGLTGIGGGSLMTPALLFWHGVPAPIAVGTDLLFAAITKSAGLLGTLRQAMVAWPVVAWLSAGSVPAAWFTLRAVEALGHSPAQLQRVITTGLGLALVLTAVANAWRLARPLPSAKSTAPTRPPRRLALLTLGLAVGALVTLTSVGAGAVGMLVLMLLLPHLSVTRLVATDLAYAVPLTALAGLGHWQLGHVDRTLLGTLLMGSVPGIWLGLKLQHLAPARGLRALMATLLALAGVKLVFA
ncbi:MAG: hypothetical protein RLZ34_1653 [Pseudomonadota bacterium]|jgi:uncharacterized membrane protein YfcA